MSSSETCSAAHQTSLDEASLTVSGARERIGQTYVTEFPRSFVRKCSPMRFLLPTRLASAAAAPLQPGHGALAAARPGVALGAAVRAWRKPAAVS